MEWYGVVIKKCKKMKLTDYKNKNLLDFILKANLGSDPGEIIKLDVKVYNEVLSYLEYCERYEDAILWCKYREQMLIPDRSKNVKYGCS